MNDALTLICVHLVLYCCGPQKEVPWLVGPTICPVPNSCAVPIACQLIQSAFCKGRLLLPAYV